ncbi:hypothetical protein [Rhodovulum sp. FJ3]|uniref:hypothetical protein n=1 Tax=Rhodovulum sp. FJ3 TaxID=3079053 RepID=UPI00293DFC92|nr:hypothetical protein [Rhodovulum sp. FJ3]MDV4167775.1 hypothetical protein [Rhodovulum sp. FJ3]
MTPEEMRKKTEIFAYGEVSAVALNGHPDDGFKEGWFPKVAGERVNCGDKHPTPEGGFPTRQAALDCAVTYQQLCRDWLVENPHTPPAS